MKTNHFKLFQLCKEIDNRLRIFFIFVYWLEVNFGYILFSVITKIMNHQQNTKILAFFYKILIESKRGQFNAVNFLFLQIFITVWQEIIVSRQDGQDYETRQGCPCTVRQICWSQGNHCEAQRWRYLWQTFWPCSDCRYR